MEACLISNDLTNSSEKKIIAVFLKKTLIPIVVLLLVTLFLTFNVLSIQSIVGGDSFYWNRSNINDLLRPVVVHESYLGDMAVVSTFKSGFLYPASLLLNVLGIPMTLLYPFLFYFLSMLAFYSLTGEFVKNKTIRLIASVLYVINPVTPYYFASLLFAFAVIFLPLSLKFFIRSLRTIDKQPGTKVSIDLILCAAFLGLSISAHEQFVFSALIIGMFLLITFTVYTFYSLGRTKKTLVAIASNILAFLLIICLVNLPLFLSLQNTANAQLSSYFTGRIDDFLANVDYTYSHITVATLLRFGGDSGVGLAQNSWFDNPNLSSNFFGYCIIALIVGAIIILIRWRPVKKADTAFYLMSLVLFFSSILLLLFVKYLPSNRPLANGLFSILLQSWESPTKLRMVMLISGLASAMLTFQQLQNLGKTRKGTILKASLLVALVASVVIYNSPWLISYAGSTPLQEISDTLGWGGLSDPKYSALSDLLQQDYGNQRGIVIPYTHKAELYVPPNFKLLQLVSGINNQLSYLTEETDISWSKLAGLISAKYLVLGNYAKNETLLFPKPLDNNFSRVYPRIRSQIANDSGMDNIAKEGNFDIYNNENTLPQLYASNYFIVYDNPNTLKYAFWPTDFSALPVFLEPVGEINKMSIPQFLTNASYDLYALCTPGTKVSDSTLNLTKTNYTTNETLMLTENDTTIYGANVYSCTIPLAGGDSIRLPNTGNWIENQTIEQIVLGNNTERAFLSSTPQTPASYGSFRLDFTLRLEGTDGARARVSLKEDSKTYYLYFHNYGTLELGIFEPELPPEQQYSPGVRTNDADYSLKKPTESINVTLIRVFDEVQVYINGILRMSFPTSATALTVALKAEESNSSFTNVNMKTADIVRLFAIRNKSEPLDFTIDQQGPDQAVLNLVNPNSQYAIVDQYLNTPLRNIKTELNSSAINANLFFNGWIVNPNLNSGKQISVTIGIQNSQTFFTLTYLSIAATCTILITGLIPITRKPLVDLSKRLKSKNQSH
jgi:hypothetical protein